MATVRQRVNLPHLWGDKLKFKHVKDVQVKEKKFTASMQGKFHESLRLLQTVNWLVK